MTYMEMIQRLDQVMAVLQASIPSDPTLPKQTGNLASSVKIRKASYGFDIYMEVGSLTTSEWEEQPISGMAPYAVELNNYKPYWRRFAFSVRDKINFQLNGQFKTEHRPGVKR